jgi:hypothetical protein
MFNFGFGVPNKPVSASAPAFGINGFQISSTNYQWVHTPTANPTTRPDGSALLSGDQIQDSTTGDVWRWNGTLWLSREFQGHSWFNSIANNTTVNTIFDAPIGQGMFVKEVTYSFVPGGTVNTTATVTLTTTLRTLGAASTVLFTSPIPIGTVITTGVRTSLKHSAGVNVPKTVGAAASGVLVSGNNLLGFTITSFSLGIRWAFFR